MCQKCLDATKKYYPNLSDDDRFELLISATSYPMGDPAQIEQQLADITSNTDGTLDSAIGYAEMLVDKAMTEFNRNVPKYAE